MLKYYLYVLLAIIYSANTGNAWGFFHKKIVKKHHIPHLYEEIRSPVILVPGSGGSQLEVRLDKKVVPHYFCEKKTSRYFSLWLNLADVVPLAIDCWVDNMRLVYNNRTRRTSGPQGVHVRVPGFGNTSTVEYVDPSQVAVTGYYNVLVNDFVKAGYRRGIDLRGAPYDFRKSPVEQEFFYRRLGALVEQTYRINGNKRVVLICHSYGCMVTLYYLNRRPASWKNHYIRNLITLAAPWGGSMKALKAFTSGDNFGLIVVPALKFRSDERSFPSLAFLMPHDNFWPDDENIVYTDDRNYTTANYKEYFTDINYTIGHEMWLDAKRTIQSLKPPQVETHCIHGYGVPTMAGLNYLGLSFPDKQPNLIEEDGDSTVNVRSLQGCLRWQQFRPIYYRNFSNVDHMSVMTDTKVLEHIRSIVIRQRPVPIFERLSHSITEYIRKFLQL